MTSATTERVDAVLVGAGFSGLYMAHKLNELGFTFQGFEAAGDVGGTWFWNRYPGARTDSLHHIYCYSFSKELAQEWSWTERYPSQPEMLSYLSHVADRFDLRKHFRFGTRVQSAHFDGDNSEWVVSTESGDVIRARFVITAVGLLSAPNIPPFTGIENFQGDWYHTARWPHDEVDFTGKRVAVIGTGSTGIQIAPKIAETAGELTIFQRTPNYVVPAQNRPLSTAEQADIKARYTEIWRRLREHPFAMDFQAPGRNALDVDAEERERIYEEAWGKGGFHFLFEAFDDLQVDEVANETACEFIRSKIRQAVDDPEVAELLSPRGYPYGSKRPPSGTGYYEIFNRDNVRLVDVSTDSISEVTAEGLRTQSGRTWEFDAIVFATGFDASTGSLTRIDIRGRDGIELATKWEGGPVTNLGFSTADFPNLIMLSGPLSPFANIPVCSEENVDWVAACLSHMRENGLSTIEAEASAEAEWVAHVNDVANQILAAKGEKVNTWFAGANIDGKAHAINVYFGGSNAYFKACRDAAAAGYKGFILA